MHVWEERDVSIVHSFNSRSSAELKAKNPTYRPDSALEPQSTFIQYHRQETEAEDEQPGLRANGNPDRSSIHPSSQVSQSFVFKILFVNLKNRERERTSMIYPPFQMPAKATAGSILDPRTRPESLTWVSDHLLLKSWEESWNLKLDTSVSDTCVASGILIIFF